MEKTIRVRGSAQIKVRPDYVKLLFTLRAEDESYEEAMRTAAWLQDKLKASIAEAGLKADDLKTTDFNVDKKYESFRDDKDVWRRVFKCYEVRQELVIGFDFVREDLLKTLSAIATCEADPEFTVRFTVKDSSAVKTALFEKASANARQIAETLTRTSGVSLGELVTIDYSWAEIDIQSDMKTGFLCEAGGYESGAPDIDPEELTASDSVTFVWRIG